MEDNINLLIAEYPKEKQAQLLEFLQSSQILGNPLLEEYFIREHASVLQLMKHEELRKQYQLDLDNWVAGLEPRLQEQAVEFFASIEEHVSRQVENLVQANLVMAEALDNAVKTAQGEIAASAKQLTEKLEAAAESERRRVQEKLISSLNSKLDPHVEKAFKKSSEKFRALSILRDVGVVVVGLCIFYGIKMFFWNNKSPERGFDMT